MAERSNAPVLKTGVLRGTGGSNPSPSARVEKYGHGFVFFYGEISFDLYCYGMVKYSIKITKEDFVNE